MNIHEMKITNDIRQDRSRGQQIWDNINKLRGKITDKEEKVVMYTDKNEQILNTQEIEQYWTKIYRKHQNEIDKELIEKEMQEKGNAMHGITTFDVLICSFNLFHSHGAA